MNMQINQNNARLYVKEVKKGDKTYRNLCLDIGEITGINISFKFDAKGKLAYKVKKMLEK